MTLRRPSSSLNVSTSTVLASATAGSSGASGSSLWSAIDALLEWKRSDALVGVDETLARIAALEIGGDQRVDRFDDLVGGNRGAEDLAERGVAEIDVAAQADLVELDAVLVDAEDADVADMMMAAGVDAARDLYLQVADVVLARQAREVVEMRCATGIERALARAQ